MSPGIGAKGWRVHFNGSKCAVFPASVAHPRCCRFCSVLRLGSVGGSPACGWCTQQRISGVGIHVSTSSMALSSAAQAFKQGVLRHLRVPVQQAVTSTSAQAAGALSLWRGFAGGGYLDKDEVIQRVLHVTKHFEKIDPAKVRPCYHARDLGAQCGMRSAAVRRGRVAGATGDAGDCLVQAR
jgi:hypothetical protein